MSRRSILDRLRTPLVHNRTIAAATRSPTCQRVPGSYGQLRAPVSCHYGAIHVFSTVKQQLKDNMAHQTFPTNIPAPKDDGAYDHLTQGYGIPSVFLPVAKDPSSRIDLSKQEGMTIVFCYPRTAAPDETVPDEWNSIPGARGCTPQACSFRDNFSELQKLGVSRVFGVSTQTPSYQAEVHERLHLPYDLLSDEHLQLQQALNLPVFEWQGTTLLKRSSIVVKDGKILKSFYPVFPPDRGVQDVIEWLKEQK